MPILKLCILDLISRISGIVILYSDITFKQSTDNPYNALELIMLVTFIMTPLLLGRYALKLFFVL